MFPSRRPGELQEDPIRAEGGSRIQNEDQLQGKSLVSVNPTMILCLSRWTVGVMDMLVTLVMGNCSAVYHFCCILQVNKEIVSGLKYIQTSTRKGVKGKTSDLILSLPFLT